MGRSQRFERALAVCRYYMGLETMGCLLSILSPSTNRKDFRRVREGYVPIRIDPDVGNLQMLAVVVAHSYRGKSGSTSQEGSIALKTLVRWHSLLDSKHYLVLVSRCAAGSSLCC